MKVLQLAGIKKSGKTALCEELILKAVKKGLRCAVIKNIHGELTLTGKNDGERFLKAGAREVFLRQEGLVNVLKPQAGFMDLIRQSGFQYDLLFVEGFKSLLLPCIWCMKENDEVMEKENILGYFTLAEKRSSIIPSRKLPLFSGLREETVENLWTLIVALPPFPAGLDCGLCGKDCVTLYAEMMKNPSCFCPVQKEEKDVDVSINGKTLALMPFVRKLLRETVKGFLGELKGYEDGTIHITVYQKTKEEKK